MYITITDILGEKRIDLDYPIKNSNKEITVVSSSIDNIQYKFTEDWTIDLESRSKRITAGTYKRREFIDIVEGKIEMTQFDGVPRIIKTNKLEGITEMVFDLDELDNTNNLKNGSPSNTLFTYHVTSY